MKKGQSSGKNSSSNNPFDTLADNSNEVPEIICQKLTRTLELNEAAQSSSELSFPTQLNTTGKLGVKLKSPLVWIDLEMTGLDIDRDQIIEIACIITDGSLSRLIEGPELAIHHSDDVLSNMNAWCIEHHGNSGLTQRVRESVVSVQEAEKLVLNFVKQHIDEKDAPLAGNSVHVDRMFLVKYMPSLVDYLSHRCVDVSSISELAKRWCLNAYKNAPRKSKAHEAMSDIKESIEELKHYKKCFFK